MVDGQNLDSAVLIRFLEQTPEGRLVFKSGGGITFQSDVKSEYEEMKRKVYVRFIETIRLEHGRILHAGYHNRRLNATRRAWWGEMPDLHVEDYIVPEYTERTRCRIVYGREIESVEYFAYQPRQVRRLRLLAL